MLNTVRAFDITPSQTQSPIALTDHQHMRRTTNLSCLTQPGLSAKSDFEYEAMFSKNNPATTLGGNKRDPLKVALMAKLKSDRTLMF